MSCRLLGEQRLQRLVAVSRCGDSVQPCADAVYLPNELLALARMQLCGEQNAAKTKLIPRS